MPDHDQLMRVNLDCLPLELFRLVIQHAATSKYSRQIMRTNISMVNKTIRHILAPDLREVAWFSPRQLEAVPLDPDSVARLETASTLVVCSPPRRPTPPIDDKAVFAPVAQQTPQIATDEHVVLRILARFRKIRHLRVLSPPDCAWRVRFCFEASHGNPLTELESIYIENCNLRVTTSAAPARMCCQHLTINECYASDVDLAPLLEMCPLHLRSLRTVRLGILLDTGTYSSSGHIPAIFHTLLDRVEAVQILDTAKADRVEAVQIFGAAKADRRYSLVFPPYLPSPRPVPPEIYFETHVPVLFTIDHIIDDNQYSRPRQHSRPRLAINPASYREARFVQLAAIKYEHLAEMTKFLAALPKLHAVFLWRRLDPDGLKGGWKDDARALVKMLQDAGVDVIFTEPDDEKHILPEFLTYIRQHANDLASDESDV
ncbi:hypothetical protein JCM10908_007323 [Rhodotorula pacifica]|uniref:uncharacterized protein n=1 Tax=Rhodotorula pacifica TaxID=1495444 RepID=UPI0031772C9F